MDEKFFENQQPPGDGADIFLYSGNSGNKTIIDYAASDTVSLVGATLQDASVKSNGDVVFKIGSKKITLEGAADETITFSEDGTLKTFSNGVIYDSNETSATVPAKYKSSSQKTFAATVTDIDATDAQSKVNLLATATDGATIESGKGNDTLAGGEGADYISGGKGKDSISGGAEGDTLWGGKGRIHFTATPAPTRFFSTRATAPTSLLTTRRANFCKSSTRPALLPST